MRYGRERLAGNVGVVFAHRYITRPVDLNGENHVVLSDVEFDARLAAGLFAMHWESHGLRYGIGREINFWMAKGCNVVMNGSREYLAEARHAYPALMPILVTVSPDILRARLHARGRESDAQITQRLLRAEQFKCLGGYMETILNDGELDEAGEHFVTLLSAVRLPTRAEA